MSDETIKTTEDGQVEPTAVQTPAQLRGFLTLLDKQVAIAIQDMPGSEAAVALAANIRARGLHWALTRACEMMDRQEARIAELERRGPVEAREQEVG